MYGFSFEICMMMINISDGEIITFYRQNRRQQFSILQSQWMIEFLKSWVIWNTTHLLFLSLFRLQWNFHVAMQFTDRKLAKYSSQRICAIVFSFLYIFIVFIHFLLKMLTKLLCVCDIFEMFRHNDTQTHPDTCSFMHNWLQIDTNLRFHAEENKNIECYIQMHMQ